MDENPKTLRLKLSFGAALLVGLAGMIYLQMEYDLYHKVIHLIQKDMPMELFLVLMIFLPLAGFPLSAFIFPLGVKFGLIKGMILLELILPLHFIIAYVLAIYLRRAIQNFLVNQKKYQIPTIPEDRMLLYSFLFLACPVFPYSVKLYILPLAGLPFRYYFWLNWLIQGTLCIPFVLLGKSAADLDASVSIMNILIFVVALVIFFAMLLLLRRAQKRLDSPQKENQ
ncbi:MAG: hypothetical protein MUE70_03340 [Desulfobacterales bacterium]|jgi:uncharacterized membrane protein YdjX (TVP38/TMEM64 family)|nr:hypothetical protein [Desulfobacterales bacterium]